MVAPSQGSAPGSAAPPPCGQDGGGWCLARRISGDVPNGELGFRFGSPLDVDGDGVIDIAAGARWKLARGVLQNGVAAVWSGATGRKIREWDGTVDGAMFGHSVLPIPDLDGDRLADVVISAPTATIDGTVRGMLSARSPSSGKLLWSRASERKERLGWDLALAGDQNGDEAVDLFAGAPCDDGGRVYLLSGKDGTTLRTYEPAEPRWSFGWYVAGTDDVDADGHRDVAVGAFLGEKPGDPMGAVFLFSAETGALLRRWDSTDGPSAFGEVVASVGDLDGDGRGEIAVSAAYSGDPARSRPGEVRVFSSISGTELRRWVGKQPGEYYGRMVANAGDVDGDGTGDVAIGAPQHRVGDADKTGRVELRSGKTGAVLAEWFGDGADSWFGWHIRRAPDPDGRGRPALLIGSLRHPVGGHAGVGVLDLYLLQARAGDPGQGTITRGERRSDIR